MVPDKWTKKHLEEYRTMSYNQRLPYFHDYKEIINSWNLRDILCQEHDFLNDLLDFTLTKDYA